MSVIIAYTNPPEHVRKYLEENAELHVIRPNKEREKFMEMLPKAEALIGAGLPVNQELLDQAPELRVVSNASAGVDNLDVDLLTEEGIVVTNTPSAVVDTMADTMFGLMIGASRRLMEMHELVKNGQWDRNAPKEWFGLNVHHKKLGIIGMGGIGKEIARRAKEGFRMEVSYYNRSRHEEAEKETGAVYEQLGDLLASSDMVMVLLPLTSETKHMIGAEAFRKMKSTAVFLNGGRGSVVDEQALITALQEKEIFAAGLDVFEEEPLPSDHPFFTMPEVTLLPHIGTGTTETREAMYMEAAGQCVKALAGEKPEALVNKKVWGKGRE
ncbi:D-glycerate dehydrogenase [Marinococcus sp. PL1-022]|uniref:2-hydroxyacid dehydrogenase n=1 Tax=Marinococcus sp. PL1-022 TaxID=3095363 RepID=UPI0029C2D565|nr:D-glycerate dehydrogenase [Marinococcus sp. PL1-022]MDX6154057.1 D-glycerate dehydrogenase [Marinococcus sp. PL1-022]